jgi:hypothetical protein|tara:strand:+ start:29 stop:364 length:336 start_codon:yes stop_codon:yes gene_type:complete
MKKEFTSEKTQTVTNFWIDLSDDKRRDLVNKELRKDESLNEFEVYQTLNDGQIVFKVSKTIPSNKRGEILLDLEDKLKKNIDIGLTVWFEPVGDKSKLRNLRGVKISSNND